jgi:hypothetical protein
MVPLLRKARMGVGLPLALSVFLTTVPGLRTVASAVQDPRLSLEGAVGWINTDGPIHLEKLRG